MTDARRPLGRSTRPALSTLLAAALAAAPLIGCGNTSTLTLTDGREIEAVIDGGDAETLQVRHPLERIARAEIADIDYPGGAAIVVGWGLTGAGLLYGGVGAAVSSAADRADDSLEAEIERGLGVALLVTGVFLTAIGLPLLIEGSLREDRAREASHPPGGALVVQPFIGPTGVGVRF